MHNIARQLHNSANKVLMATLSCPRKSLVENARETKQETQLSQKDRHRSTLRVIEYFAKSLKVIRNDNVE